MKELYRTSSKNLLPANRYEEIVSEMTTVAGSEANAQPANQNLEHETRLEAEILAAKRSLKTNAFFTLFLGGMMVSLILVNRSLRPSLANLLSSSVKAILPLFTAVANFGTVHDVLVKYIQFVKCTLLSRNLH